MTLQSLLTTLVSYKTVSENRPAMDALFAWIEDTLSDVPLIVRRYEAHGYPALVLTTSRKKTARLWLAAHIDVVPATDRLFTPKVRAGKLYGRGAFDMKCAIACYLRLLQEIGKTVCTYDLGIMLTADEELGADGGVHHLLTKEKYTGEVVFLPDGVGSWQFERAAKGTLKLEITARGERAHGSRPWQGRSAIHALCAYIHDAVRAFEPLTQTNVADHWHSTMHAGHIHGGEAFNTVAPNASAILDIRYPNKEEFRAIQRILAHLHTAHPHVDVRILDHTIPYGIKMSNGYAKTFARIAQQEGRECGWACAHGSSDARCFNAAGMPTILIAPEGGDAHSDHEWVDLNDLEVYYRVLRRFVEEVATR